MTRKRYTDLGDSGGLYRRELYIETKSQEETGTETSSGVDSPQGGVAWGGHLSYLVKTIKIFSKNNKNINGGSTQ
jgi:hypothetical protein